MNYGLHVIKFPTGKFGYRGTIPAVLGEPVEASTADVMGGRAFRWSDGSIRTMKFPVFESAELAVKFAADRNCIAKVS